MTKRKVIRESNRLFTYNPNYYNWGGDFKEALKGLGPFDLKSTFSGTNVANMLKGGLASGLGSTLGNIGGNLISGGLESSAGNTFSNIGGTVGKAISAVNPVLGGLMSAGSGIIGGGINAVLGSKLNQEKINEIEGSNEGMNTLVVDNSNTDTIENQWANQNFGVDFTQSDIGKDGLFSNKAKNKYKELKLQQDIARNRAFASYKNAINSADFNQDLNLLQNYAAYGGPLNKYAIGGDKTPWYQPFLEGLWGATYDSKGNYKGNALFKKTPKKGTFGGGSFEGAGASGNFPIINDYSSLTFNEAFDKAYKNKEKEFKYGEKYYNTEKETNPIREVNNRFVGNSKDRAKLKATDNYQYTVGPVNLYGLETVPFVEQSPFAYGGLLDMNNQYSDGGKIYIKPENRGKFTALKERTGKSATWFKEHGTPAQKKMATFALNAAKWHSLGGPLSTHGLDLSNGVVQVNNGNTHENNKYEGVQMGIDNQGIPNLVEEGEVVFNDYVFSNRLKVPKAMKNKYRLRGNKELTFADAAKQMQKESEERPNDPISKRGLMSSMTRLQQAQETVRQQTQEGQEGVQYAHGGKMGTLFDGTGDKPNIMARAKAKRLGYDVGNSLKDYFEDPVYENEDTNKGFDLTQLRYAPVVGAAIGLGQNLFSRPDYTSADAILEAANQAGNYTPIGYTPIGNYLQYRPFDRSFYINKLNAQAGATRRAIMNTTSPSRNAALLAADYNAQGKLGDLARQAEEYNLAQRQAVETFNRGTNQANAEMGLKTAMANQEAALKAKSQRLSGVAQAMTVRDAVDARRGASMSANLTNLFDSLGNIGIDEMNRADRDFYIKHVMGANLPLEEYRRLYGLDAAKKEAKNRGFTDNEITKLFKNGGKLKKRRGGLTY